MLNRDVIHIAIKETAAAIKELARAAGRPADDPQGQGWDLDAARLLLKSALEQLSGGRDT